MSAPESPVPNGPTRPLEMSYGDAGDLARVRAIVRARAGDLGLPTPRADLLSLAVSELATNTLQHTDGGGRVRLRAEPGRLLFSDLTVDQTTGQAHYDNYGGRWGAEEQLHRFLQMYAVEKAKLEARKRGHSVTEQALADGSIKLTIQVSGGAA